MKTENHEIEDWLASRPATPPSRGRFPCGTTLGEWRTVAYLGKGCSAEVYRVVNTRTGREGALKLLVSEDAGIRDRFLVEMDTIRFLQQGAFPTFYGSGVSGGSPYYVMEYLRPLSFPPPRKEIPDFIVSVAKAVQRLHTAGYVHRDLKPVNILRRPNGEPVLIDPGLVKKMEKTGTQAQPFALSQLNGRPLGVGTLGFAAPEQLIKGIASARSDVFSLGKVLSACFDGKVPQGPWQTIIRRATQEAPEDRYASADDFARAVRRRHYPVYFRIAFYSGLAVLLSVLGISWSNSMSVKPLPPSTVVVEIPAGPEVLLKKKSESETAHFKRLLPLAETGNVTAQLLVAEAYFYGRGPKKDHQKAFQWYQQAAKAQNHDAEASLGLCYLHGYGCEPSDWQAVQCFLLAVEGGNVVAMTNLAYCYMNDRGVEKDVKEGFRLAQRAAERGHAPGQVMLAECFLLGLGVERNQKEAEVWLKAAARQGNKRAIRLLETLDAANSPAPTEETAQSPSDVP